MPVKKLASDKLERYETKGLERAPGDRWITMSNALTRAGHGLTLAEKRMVSAALSMLNSREKPIRSGEVPRTRIMAAEYAETFGVDIDTAYNQLKSTAKKLYSRSITFYEPAHKRQGRPIEPTMVQMRWIGSAKYQKGEGWVELAWWPDLIVHLLGLKAKFTSYQLKQTSALRSAYSWKLLELLTRFESNGWAQYSIEDFCTAMDATPKQRENFNNIKRRIIEPAVKELSEKDGWIIQWRPLKKGRKVAAVRFEFKRDERPRLL